MTKGGWVAVPPTTVWINSCIVHACIGMRVAVAGGHACVEYSVCILRKNLISHATNLSAIADWYVCHLRWLPVCMNEDRGMKAGNLIRWTDGM